MKIRYIWLLGIVLSLHACKTKNETYKTLSCTNDTSCYQQTPQDGKVFGTKAYDDLKNNKCKGTVGTTNCDATQYDYSCEYITTAGGVEKDVIEFEKYQSPLRTMELQILCNRQQGRFKDLKSL